MGSRLCLAFLAVAVLLGIVLAAQPLSAQSFAIPAGGFTAANVCPNSPSPAATCLVLTDGFPAQPQVVSGGVLRLTTAQLNQHGTAWINVQQPVSTGFTISFQFRISNTNSCPFCSFPADGLALVLQNDPAGTGAIGYVGNGQNMAYGNNDVSTASGPGKAILNSMAFELDTHQNSDYGDPNGNHIAVQSCGPNNAETLSPNSADHNYICADGNPAKLALASLPAGMSLTDQNTHTFTVNYQPPGACVSNCNNLSVFFDSTLILQATVDITKQLNLAGGTSAYVGFAAATGAVVENNDIVSVSYSQWPLAPITINQPVQTTVTNFNYTSNLNALVDYSQSGLPANSFQGLTMQGTVQTITDQQYSDLSNNTPAQGSTCQHVDTGNGNFACVVTTDLCTTSSNSVPAGANCLSTGTNPLIGLTHSYNLDPAQQPVVAPGYIMGTDTALNCGAGGDNTCKGLRSIFTSISGDNITTKGKTDNFNSIVLETLGQVQPSTTITTTPPLNIGWTNGAVIVHLNGTETIPATNTNPPSPLPTVTSISYSVSGANPPSPASGVINGASGAINLPGTNQGSTVITYSANDSFGSPETAISNVGSVVSSASPTFTVNTDLIPPTITGPTVSPAAPSAGQIVTVTASCADGGSGVVLCGPSGSAMFSATANTGPLNFPADNTVGNHVFTVFAQDLAGNQSSSSVNYTVTGPIAFSATTIDFGTVVEIKSFSQTVTVTNVGNTKVLFGVPTITASPGTDKYDFQYTDKCRGYLAPKASCTITAFFKAQPNNLGIATESFAVNYNAPGSPTVITVTANVIK